MRYVSVMAKWEGWAWCVYIVCLLKELSLGNDPDTVE